MVLVVLLHLSLSALWKLESNLYGSCWKEEELWLTRETSLESATAIMLLYKLGRQIGQSFFAEFSVLQYKYILVKIVLKRRKKCVQKLML